MLLTLSIQNFAIINSSQIQFDRGLNIITGETGAGKSILMGALGLILGNRADTKDVMQGKDKCVIEAAFSVEGYHLQGFFEANELDEINPCIVRRELTANGKSRAFINDTPVTLQVLRSFGLQLIDIVSQHQTLELNESSFQLQVLDAIANNQDVISNYKYAFKSYKKALLALQELQHKEANSRQDEDYLRFVLGELQELNPKEGEQEILEARLDELSNAEGIQVAASFVSGLLEGGEHAILDQLREGRSQLATAAKHHSILKVLLERLDSNLEDLKDLSRELQTIADQTQLDPEGLQAAESRLQQLFHLQKKHKVNGTTELIALMKTFEERFEALGTLENEIEAAKVLVNVAQANMIEHALKLRNTRKAALTNACEQVNELLGQVALTNAVFEISLNELEPEKYTQEGAEEISFLFSANKGFEPQPINKVASGGELSRLMLCIKSLIADKVQLPSIVFDEIDTGISGEAAQKVALVMQKHAKNHQVIAITHLPQIAGKAKQHLYVYKDSEGAFTQTHIKSLNLEERVTEIARMLSGENPSENVKAAARELMA
jgi:DNA repair protein RecN (Recombination protein N)